MSKTVNSVYNSEGRAREERVSYISHSRDFFNQRVKFLFPPIIFKVSNDFVGNKNCFAFIKSVNTTVIFTFHNYKYTHTIT